MNKYDLVNVKGLECYYLGVENDKHKYLCKDCLTAKQIAKYGDGDNLMIYEDEVRFQDNIRNTDFEKSYIKSVILNNMAKDLKCEVSLLSKEDVEKLDDEIKKSNNWYWTKTYYMSPYSGYSSHVFSVYSTGCLNIYYAYVSIAVRPVLYLETKIKNESQDIESLQAKIEEQEIEIERLKERIEELEREPEPDYDTPYEESLMGI